MKREVASVSIVAPVSDRQPLREPLAVGKQYSVLDGHVPRDVASR
jgi:hypothetical protein